MKTLHIILVLAAVLTLMSCSQTRNMPEDEILYKGIKEISYGQRARCVVKLEQENEQQESNGTGVITAVADAVMTVDSLLHGRKDVAVVLDDIKRQKQDKTLDSNKRDSLKHELELISETYDAAKTEVDAALACKPNGSLMGSSKIVSPLPIGLYVYNAFSDAKTAFGKWILNTFGESPVYLSTVNPRTRVRVARNILRNYGFFAACVEYDILPMKDTLKAKLAYSIYPGMIYRLDSIGYLHFPTGIDTLVAQSLNSSLLRVGDAFNAYNLDEERTRISEMLRNKGYYNFRPDYITYKADTLQRSGWVNLHVEPATGLPQEATKQYVLGRTDVTLLKYDDYEVVDSVRFGKRALSNNMLSRLTRWRSKNKRQLPRPRKLTMRYSGRAGQQPLRLSELRKYMFYTEGDLYNYTRMTRVRERMTQMGIFSQLQMDFLPRPAADSLSPDTLDIAILAMLDKPYDSEFSASIVNKSNGLLGPSLSYSISKRNAFHRAETMKLKIYGSYEWQTGAKPTGGQTDVSVNSYEIGGQLSLSYPRLIMPEGRRLSRSAISSTDFGIDISWMNRSGYYSMAQFKGDVTYSYKGRPYISHSFTPLSVRYLALLSRTADFDAVLQRSPAMEVSMRDQIVPSMEYTIMMTSRRKAHHPRAFTMSFKQAGNLTNGLFAAFGRGWRERDKQLLGVPFAQFVKMTAEYKEEVRMAHGTSLVGRVFAGVVYSYGNATMAPYSDLFCVGGANSIRAFCLRGIGPGRYNPAGSGYSYIDQMGDMKFEINAEFRFPIVGNLYGAAFIDAGNVWLMKADDNRPGSGFSLKHFGKDLALGTGLGVRYDLSFLVLRFDIGVGIHAPYNTGSSGYYNMPRFLDSLGYHLAVGYPF